MKASPIRISQKEMKVMYDAICKYKLDFPDAVMDFTSLEDYIDRTLKNIATESHGPAILVDDQGNEMKSVDPIFPPLTQRI
jgi:hypothetical protein